MLESDHKIVIYAIMEYRTRSVYIGQSSSFEQRLAAHLGNAFNEKHSVRKREWLIEAGLRGALSLRILAVCTSYGEAQRMERQFFTRALEANWNLINQSPVTYVHRPSNPAREALNSRSKGEQGWAMRGR